MSVERLTRGNKLKEAGNEDTFASMSNTVAPNAQKSDDDEVTDKPCWNLKNIPRTLVMSPRHEVRVEKKQKEKQVQSSKYSSALEAERLKESTIYHKSRLNREQLRIFNYMKNNPRNMIVVQAGPGTGKTFTTLTIAYTETRPVNVIIFKHDLLHSFRYCSELFTVARFFMELLKLTYYEYTSLEMQMSGGLTSYEFISAIVGLLRRANLPKSFAHALVILDEYTVIPKPLLFILLLLLKHHQIGTIVSGDRNQLQNIRNSKHAQCSSYDITQVFADASFTLEINQRCGDAEYNDIITYLSSFSSDRKLDLFGYAMVSAIFHPNLMRSTSITDTHMAARHQDLTDTMHMLVMQHEVPTAFYYIDASTVRSVDRVQGTLCPNGLYMPVCVTRYMEQRRPGKFLPYIPLIVGTRYFVNTLSEHSQATLIGINSENNTLEMQADDGQTYTVFMKSSGDMMLEQHRDFVLHGGSGKIYNYPIYLANMMSIHMSQGRTINNQVDIILNNTSYQGLYVAASRVRSLDQITRVVIPDMLSHVVSTIINFPELCNTTRLTVDTIKRGFVKYIFYKIPNDIAHNTSNNDEGVARKIIKFIYSSVQKNERTKLREELLECVSSCHQTILNPPNDEDDNNLTNLTMKAVLKYKDVLLALSRLEDSRDGHVWFHEFMLANEDMAKINTHDQLSDEDRFGVLKNITGINKCYPRNVSTRDYIKQCAQQSRKRKEGNSQIWLEEYSSTDMVLETTQFQRDVYTLLQHQIHLTNEWLMAYLQNEMNRLSALQQLEERDAIKECRKQ